MTAINEQEQNLQLQPVLSYAGRGGQRFILFPVRANNSHSCRLSDLVTSNKTHGAPQGPALATTATVKTAAEKTKAQKEAHRQARQRTRVSF